jgi:hypothetical protein
MSELKARVELAKVIHLLDGLHDPSELVINRGAEDGLKLGQRFLVFGQGPELTDPDTGESLGQLELVRGRGEVVHLQENMATLRSVETRRSTRGRRIIRNSPYSMGIGAAAGIIEEELPGEREQPFVNVQLGDLARPI